MRNPLTQPIKSYLIKNGFKGISVKNGRGTAWGWVEIDYGTSRPDNCTCTDNHPYCAQCREEINKKSREIERLAYLAVKIAGLEFHHYHDDFGDTRDNILIQVWIA